MNQEILTWNWINKPNCSSHDVKKQLDDFLKETVKNYNICHVIINKKNNYFIESLTLIVTKLCQQN